MPKSAVATVRRQQGRGERRPELRDPGSSPDNLFGKDDVRHHDEQQRKAKPARRLAFGAFDGTDSECPFLISPF
jgi:hypothetical protein